MLASGLASGLVAATSAATASPGLSHIPPERATAGDDLVLATRVVPSCLTDPCSPPTVSVRYAKADGSTGEATGQGTSAGEQTVNVTVPGDAVRFPELSYNVAATVGIRDGTTTVPFATGDYRVPPAGQGSASTTGNGESRRCRPPSWARRCGW